MNPEATVVSASSSHTKSVARSVFNVCSHACMCLCSCVTSTHVAARKLTGEAARAALRQWHPVFGGAAEISCFGVVVLLIAEFSTTMVRLILCATPHRLCVVFSCNATSFSV